MDKLIEIKVTTSETEWNILLKILKEVLSDFEVDETEAAIISGFISEMENAGIKG